MPQWHFVFPTSPPMPIPVERQVQELKHERGSRQLDSEAVQGQQIDKSGEQHWQRTFGMIKPELAGEDRVVASILHKVSRAGLKVLRKRKVEPHWTLLAELYAEHEGFVKPVQNSSETKHPMNLVPADVAV